MRAEDLHHKELLELDPDGGLIRFAGQRALLHRNHGRHPLCLRRGSGRVQLFRAELLLDASEDPAGHLIRRRDDRGIEQRGTLDRGLVGEELRSRP